MYGKIFESMYEGSLYGQWEALVTFQQLIVLADEQGVIDMTPPAIAGKTSIPLDIIEKGIDILSKPDPYSRTLGEEGIRIQLLDDHRPWGWYIVNYQLYRDMVRREDKLKADRERIAKKREKSNEINNVAECRILSHSVADVAHTDTDTDTKQKKGQVTLTAGFDDFWNAYPKKRKKKTALDIWKRKKLCDNADHLVADVRARIARAKLWRAGFVPDPTTYLNGERWNDELELEQIYKPHITQEPTEAELAEDRRKADEHLAELKAMQHG